VDILINWNQDLDTTFKDNEVLISVISVVEAILVFLKSFELKTFDEFFLSLDTFLVQSEFLEERFVLKE
jgi:hypothetical protein